MKVFYELYVRFMVWLGAIPPPGYENLLQNPKKESRLTSIATNQSSRAPMRMIESRWVRIFVVGVIALVIILLIIGLQPCGWLDIHLKRSGCILKLSERTSAKIIDFTPDGNLLVSSWDGKLRLWRTTDGILMRVLDEYISPSGEALSPDGKTLAVPSGPGVQLRAFDNGHLLHKLQGNTGRVVNIIFSPKGEMVAAAVYDRPPKVQLWRVIDATLLHTLEGHISYVNDVAISPDGTILASGSNDKTVRLWQVTDGILLRILEGHKYSVESVAFSPDGVVLASGSSDKTIRLWRVSDGKLLQELKGHSDQVITLAFSPDGTILASGDTNGALRLWRVTDGALLRTVKLGLLWGSVRNINFSPDGTMVATAQGRGPVRVFDVQQVLK